MLEEDQEDQYQPDQDEEDKKKILWQPPVPLDKPELCPELWQLLMKKCFDISARAKQLFGRDFRLNILVCGPWGAGKSSFVNTIHTIFRHSLTVAHTYSMTSSSLGHGTKQIHFSLLENLALTLIDTWGFTKTSIESGQLTKILGGLVAGVVEDKFHKDHTLETSQFSKLNPKRDEKLNVVTVQDKPHAVLLLYNVEANVPLKSMRTCVDVIKQAQTHPEELDTDDPHALEITTVLSKADKLDPQTLNKKIEETYESSVVRHAVLRVGWKLGLDSTSVYPCRFYYHGEQSPNRDRRIEIMAMAALSEAMHSALTFVRREKRREVLFAKRLKAKQQALLAGELSLRNGDDNKENNPDPADIQKLIDDTQCTKLQAIKALKLYENIVEASVSLQKTK